MLFLALALAGFMAGPGPLSKPDAQPRLCIALGGDTALPIGPNDVALDALGPRVFDGLRPWLAQADLAFTNLEAPLTDRPAIVRKAFPMTSPPRRLAWIVDAGFDLFSLANNHMADAGRPGVEDTIAALTAARAGRPLWWAGAGATARDAAEPVIVTPAGSALRIGFLAVGNGAAPEVAHFDDRRALLARVKRLRAGTDLVIVSVHGGTEYQHAAEPDLVALFRALVDAGADIVVGTHPHVLRGVERRGRGLILHGLGNLAFGTLTDRHRARGGTLYGMLALVDVALADGALERVRLVPLWVDNGYPLELPDLPASPPAAFVPRPLTGPHARAALDAIRAWSAAIPGNATVIGDDGDLGVVDLRVPGAP